MIDTLRKYFNGGNYSFCYFLGKDSEDEESRLLVGKSLAFMGNYQRVVEYIKDIKSQEAQDLKDLCISLSDKTKVGLSKDKKLKVLLISPRRDILTGNAQYFLANFLKDIFFNVEIITCGLRYDLKNDKELDFSLSTGMDFRNVVDKLPFEPDLCIVNEPEWFHIFGFEKAPFPTVALTVDFDYNPTASIEILKNFDASVVMGGISWEYLRRRGIELIYTMPGWQGYLPEVTGELTTSVKEVKKDLDLFFSGYIGARAVQDLNRLKIIRNLSKLVEKGYNLLFQSKSITNREFREKLLRTKLTFSNHRRGEMQVRIIEAIANGVFVLIDIAPQIKIDNDKWIVPNETEIFLKRGIRFITPENVALVSENFLKNYDRFIEEIDSAKTDVVDNMTARENFRKLLNFLTLEQIYEKLKERCNERIKTARKPKPTMLLSHEVVMLPASEDILEYIKDFEPKSAEDYNTLGALLLQVAVRANNNQRMKSEITNLSLKYFTEGLQRFPQESFLLAYNLAVLLFSLHKGGAELLTIGKQNIKTLYLSKVMFHKVINIITNDGVELFGLEIEKSPPYTIYEYIINPKNKANFYPRAGILDEEKRKEELRKLFLYNCFIYLAQIANIEGNSQIANIFVANAIQTELESISDMPSLLIDVADLLKDAGQYGTALEYYKAGHKNLTISYKSLINALECFEKTIENKTELRENINKYLTEIKNLLSNFKTKFQDTLFGTWQNQRKILENLNVDYFIDSKRHNSNLIQTLEYISKLARIALFGYLDELLVYADFDFLIVSTSFYSYVVCVRKDAFEKDKPKILVVSPPEYFGEVLQKVFSGKDLTLNIRFIKRFPNHEESLKILCSVLSAVEKMLEKSFILTEDEKSAFYGLIQSYVDNIIENPKNVPNHVQITVFKILGILIKWGVDKRTVEKFCEMLEKPNLDLNYDIICNIFEILDFLKSNSEITRNEKVKSTIDFFPTESDLVWPFIQDIGRFIYKIMRPESVLEIGGINHLSDGIRYIYSICEKVGKIDDVPTGRKFACVIYHKFNNEAKIERLRGIANRFFIFLGGIDKSDNNIYGFRENISLKRAVTERFSYLPSLILEKISIFEVDKN